MRLILSVCTIFVLSLSPVVTHAQQGQDPKAQALVRTSVATELAADKADQTRWRYHSTVTRPEGKFVYVVVETDHGSVKKKIEENGRRLDANALNEEMKKIDSFVHDPAQQAKQRKDSKQDDERAEKMMLMLPDAFLWSIKSDSPTATTLAFTPNPNYSAPSMEARVFAAMAGEIVVTKPGNRMQLLRGHLIHDVKFGYGLLGKMEQGGTFSVERRQIAPTVWQITDSHIHFNGHVLFFKTISEQEDEVKTDFQQTPPATTLEQAENYLRPEPTSLSAKR
ncbi:hypothetical protein [Edaphobacter flagellatus]|uniref:hypothetical protein n=1 Tax=Edaphobacter flagellatus TaxID=1933044 RepID=UPI0021B1DEDC|nr:hypothetical protein [Edaphobacter flagellatus]